MKADQPVPSYQVYVQYPVEDVVVVVPGEAVVVELSYMDVVVVGAAVVDPGADVVVGAAVVDPGADVVVGATVVVVGARIQQTTWISFRPEGIVFGAADIYPG